MNNHSIAYSTKTFDHLERMNEMELESRKRELQALGNDKPSGNSIEEIEEIIAIINKLRSGRTGPPKAKSARPAKVDLTADQIEF